MNAIFLCWAPQWNNIQNPVTAASKLAQAYRVYVSTSFVFEWAASVTGNNNLECIELVIPLNFSGIRVDLGI